MDVEKKHSVIHLTCTQQVVIEFIVNYIEMHGYSPTIREIGSAAGLRSTASVHEVLRKLCALGLITEGKNGMARSIRLNEQYDYIRNLQLKGMHLYLPCRINEEVWVIENDLIKPYTIQSYILEGSILTVELYSKEKNRIIRMKAADFGKTIFTSREKAARMYEKNLI